MADNDIYNNKKKYKLIVDNLDKLLQPPKEDDKRRKYYIKNKDNIKYFKRLFTKFEAKDNSFIRRLRLLRTFLIICHVFDKDLKNIKTQEEIDNLMAFSNKVNKSPKSKSCFALDTKFLWRQLFPETDEKNRNDSTITPYPVRHLTGKVDKSKEKMRGDKFSYHEFEKLVAAFSDDPRMQALLTMSFESLARPQELLGRKLSDVEVHDNYAKIYISEHGKEGIGLLRIIDSYFYLNQWLNKHPLKHDKNSPLFINIGRTNRYNQMTPMAANKLIRDRCKRLKLSNKITLYSLKRNGVTMLRLRGASDLDIQHTARWTSTKQLNTYDLSHQEDSFRVELVKRGIIKANKKEKQYEPTSKKCPFCESYNGIAETVCHHCKRPLNREQILAEEKKREDDQQFLKEQMAQLIAEVKDLKELKAELSKRKS